MKGNIASILIVLSCFISNISHSQKIENNDSKKINFLFSGGLGVSYFHYDVRNLNKNIHGKSYRFEAPNFRIGLIAHKSFSKKISLKMSFRLGMRMRRTSIYEDTRITGLVYPYTFAYLNDKVSGSNFFFYEIPIGLAYSGQKFKIGLDVMFRSQVPLGDFDLGLLPNLSYSLDDKFNVGLEYFIGTTKTGRDMIHDDFGNIIYFNSMNRFGQITLSYKLDAKR